MCEKKMCTNCAQICAQNVRKICAQIVRKICAQIVRNLCTMCTKCAQSCITVHKMCKNKNFCVQNVHIFVTSCVHKKFSMCSRAHCAHGFYTLVPRILNKNEQPDGVTR